MERVRRDFTGAAVVLAVVAALSFVLALSVAVWAETGHEAPAAGHEAAAAAANHGSEAAAEHGAGGHGGHHGITKTQMMNFIWHCLNFSLLAIVLFKLLRKPISGALQGRTESIRTELENLEKQKAEAQQKYAEYEKRLSNMEQEAEKILQTFIEQGKAEKEKIIAQAKEAAERIKGQAEFFVQQELAKAKVELTKTVADTAVKMAEDLIRKNLTEKDHHRLISEYLEKVVHKN